MKLPKNYEPARYEADVYKLWEKSNSFTPVERGNKEPFTIVMPPPNANGKLHAGHAVGYTLEDVIIRYKRMQGHPTLWFPGTDHAGIETQFVYERDVLAPEGKTRFDLGQDKFYQAVYEFTVSQQGTILNQFKQMGFSADWSKLKFTLDDDIIKIVYETFAELHKDGHIYRGNRIVNWCPNCQSSFADIEIEHKEETIPFYTFQYGPFQIGTARPETKFGDKYVVVHPADKRYDKYKDGESFEAEWINGKIKATLIKDEAIDMKFGTGAMTITPWHDPIDFDIAERHQLDKQQIIDESGKLLAIAGEYAGMPITEARTKVAEKLKSKGLLVKIDENYTHNVAVHDRCGTVVEPQISRQWFLRIKDLNRGVIEAFKNEEITMFPRNFRKIALNWLEQEHDWCISRQNWYGIRMPVYYQKTKTTDKKPYIIATSEEEARAYYGEGNYEAETDTFDTWFSSGQWPFATLMTTGDFDSFYPTTLMGTAREILHKWVTRMVMFGLYKTGEIPFKNVYLWGLVTDPHGKKMSKSKGNVLDPLEMTAKYGTDALRMAGAITNTPGNDSPLGEANIMAQRNFCNKLWNVARFVLDQSESKTMAAPVVKSTADGWMLQRLYEASETITKKLDGYRINEAAFHVYHLLWDDFADWYVETSKLEPNHEMLLYALETILKLAHPFTPFVTEVIWQQMHSSQQLIISSWPHIKTDADTKQMAKDFASIQLIVREVRALKRDLDLTEPGLYHNNQKLLTENSKVIAKLAGLNAVQSVQQGSGLQLSDSLVPTWLGVDRTTLAEYEAKLHSQLEETTKRISQFEHKLANKNYVDRAPKGIVEQTKEMLTEAKQKQGILQKQLKQFSD